MPLTHKSSFEVLRYSLLNWVPEFTLILLIPTLSPILYLDFPLSNTDFYLEIAAVTFPQASAAFWSAKHSFLSLFIFQRLRLKCRLLFVIVSSPLPSLSEISLALSFNSEMPSGTSKM